jgi:VWFA-related protein
MDLSIPSHIRLPHAENYTVRSLSEKRFGPGTWILAVLALSASLLAQNPSQDQGQIQPAQQDIPDAPSAVRPAQPFPTTITPSRPRPEEEKPQTAPQPTSSETTPPPPMPPVKTVPPGSVPADVNTRDDLYKIVTRVNFVLVPVTVKDSSGHMVDGLLPTDFNVYEDGKKQELKFFTSDPFPLSAAVILDTGMPDVAVQKINQTYSALAGAFSAYDEVSLYTYSSTVSQVSDFSSATGQKLTAVLNQMKLERGRNNGAPVMNGPLGPQGPTVNGIPIERPGAQPNIAPPKDVRVLNDAILKAALDLGKRDRARRKIIFIISDGREYGSRVSYSDVQKVLLSREITVYGIAVGSSAIPIYNKLEKFRLPHYGYSDILPKYASATGGEVFTELSRDNIEVAYARATGDARNQYTLGYTTRATPSSAYRDIEVRVNRPGLKITAKSGYYPLPAGQ